MHEHNTCIIIITIIINVLLNYVYGKQLISGADEIAQYIFLIFFFENEFADFLNHKDGNYSIIVCSKKNIYIVCVRKQINK